MREPKISFISELTAQIINDLCRLQHYTMIQTKYKSQLVYMPNGFIYGGAEVYKAWEFYNRWKQHKSMLEKGTHHSKKLQRSYRLTKDKSVFEFSILEEVTNEARLTPREQYYIDKYNSLYDGYNCVNTNCSSFYKAKDLKQEYYYNLFSELYIPDTVRFGKKWLSRMIDKKHMHYSDRTMRLMCVILKWFYDNYDIEDGYTMQVCVFHQSYNVFIFKDEKIVGRFFFGADTTKKIYRPVTDLTGFSTGEKDHTKLEVKLSYEDCLKKWKPIDQLRFPAN